MRQRQRKQSNDDDQPRRRPGRAPTACAECRRLKLRCDRKIPCESCVKRGCEVICPSGSLTSGKGGRLILADTEELHERIERLCYRIRLLEDALAAIQSSVSDEQHPLLQEDLLQLKNPSNIQSDIRSPSQSSTSMSDTQSPRSPRLASASTLIKLEEDQHETDTTDVPTEEEEPEDLLDAFGTLKIGPNGETTFLGHTTRSEYLLTAPEASNPTRGPNFPRLSYRILQASIPVLDGAFIDRDLGNEIFSLLPPLGEAVRLCELYLEHGKYIWSPVSRDELFEECLNVVYRADSFEALKSYHTLSFLYIVFALATLIDPSQPPYSVEAHEYYLLSWVSYQSMPQVSHVTLPSVQTMLHIAHYLELSDWEFKGSTKAWMHIRISVTLGQVIGLHMNGERWKLDQVTSGRRARVFWQVFVLDTWLSFGFGRPPGLSMAFVDCVLPPDPAPYTNPNGEVEMGFHYWTWGYTRLMHTVISTAFGAQVPSYSTILDLDRKMREFPVPQHLRPASDEEQYVPPWIIMNRWATLSTKESTLLNLHRGYFAQALQDQPNDITHHKYGPSVMAAYRSAWRLIEGFKSPTTRARQHIERLSFLWSQVLSAAIVMCLLVTRAPNSPLTASALTQLDLVVQIFENSATTCPTAGQCIGTIKKLRDKAYAAINNSPSSDTANLFPEELDRLGGRTHLITESTLQRDAYSTLGRKVSSPTLTAESVYRANPGSMMYGGDHIHPTIMLDMEMFRGNPSNFNHENDIFDYSTSASFPHQRMPNVHYPDARVFGGDVMMHATAPPGDHEMVDRDPTPPAGNPYAHAPPLDTTWQRFMEQLGV
ncbi:hypothetical protein PLICRDRAFT_162945 [Plicaturopsis crispa FD-325 SS-3]|nr:hypothetical protein PLICRDRAFT_162945 [Plicaturopsis crispa FD-325 SS-3]